MNKYIMDPGLYYIGDPHYYPQLFGDEEFTLMSGYELSNLNLSNTVHESYGDGFYLHYTAYGDGEYNRVIVDSGVIGCIRLARDHEPSKDGSWYLLRANKPFECYYDDGVFHFGSLIIDTNEDDFDYMYDDEGELLEEYK